MEARNISGGTDLKESSFIRKSCELFTCGNQDVDTWLALFESAMEKTGLDVEVKTLMKLGQQGKHNQIVV